MEEKNVCLMLAVSLHTAINLDSIIEIDDLNDEGIIKDPHITIVYDKTNKLSKDLVLNDVFNALGESEYNIFMEVLKDSYKFKINDVFYLDSFKNNDSDYLILRLKTDNEMYSKLESIHKSLMSKYSIEDDYGDYKPHVTLAELVPGSVDKYLDNNILLKVLNDSKIGFEDLVISYSTDTPGKYDKWNATSFHALERYFRENRVD